MTSDDDQCLGLGSFVYSLQARCPSLMMHALRLKVTQPAGCMKTIWTATAMTMNYEASYFVFALRLNAFENIWALSFFLDGD